MFWYLIICGLMLYPCAILYIGKKKQIDTQKLALQISCILLWFFMAMRGQMVGVDTKYYCYVFQQLSETPFRMVSKIVTYATSERTWTFNFEIGYRYYNKIVGIFSDSKQAIIIANSLVIFILLYLVIRNLSRNYFLSIWLYLTLGLFQTEMNVARNAIGILLCYMAITYVEQKNWQKYMLLIGIAGTVHKSVLVFIPLYFVLKHPFFSKKKMRMVIILSSAAGIGLSRYGAKIQAFFSGGAGRYLTASNEKTESLVVGAFYLVVVFFILFMMTRTERQEVFQRCQIGSWMFTMTMCCFGINIGMKMAARLAALFGAYMIIFIPDMLDKIEDSRRREWVTVMVGLGCGLQYILRLMINNIGGTMPYSFFWW